MFCCNSLGRSIITTGLWRLCRLRTSAARNCIRGLLHSSKVNQSGWYRRSEVPAPANSITYFRLISGTNFGRWAVALAAAPATPYSAGRNIDGEFYHSITPQTSVRVLLGDQAVVADCLGANARFMSKCSERIPRFQTPMSKLNAYAASPNRSAPTPCAV